MRKRKVRAFTLIELLVVIAIIALLMAILIPTLQRVKKQAYSVMCRSNLGQWGQLFCMYTDDNDGKWFFHRTEGKDQFTGFMMAELWYNVMKPYWYDCKDIILCPAASRYTPGGIDAPELYLGRTFGAWKEGGRSEVIGSYGFNLWLYDTGTDKRVWYPFLHPGHELWGTCRVKGASNVPVLFDCNHSLYAPCHHDIDNTWPPPYEMADAGVPRCAFNRHDGGINMLFMDWSARKVGLKELWTLKWHRYFDTANRWTKAGGVKPEDWPEWMRKFPDY